MTGQVISLRNVSKKYVAGQVETTALNSIDLEISDGEFVAVTGPSGCGKSTLLNVLGLIDWATSGEYRFKGNIVNWRSQREMREIRRRHIGFVFQDYNLIDGLTVLENVELGLRYAGYRAGDTKKMAMKVLDRLDLAPRANHSPSQLSGGQQQRGAIARAIAKEPAVLLADEPTGNLDTATGAEVMNLIQELNRKGSTVVMVTHAPELARLARRQIGIQDGAVRSDTALA